MIPFRLIMLAVVVACCAMWRDRAIADGPGEKPLTPTLSQGEREEKDPSRETLKSEEGKPEEGKPQEKKENSEEKKEIAEQKKEDKPAEPTSAEPFEAKVRPFLQKHCLECHGEKEPAGGLALHKFKEKDSITKHRKVWKKVAHNIRTHAMPPEEKPRPDADEVESIAAWITTELNNFDCSGQHDPGRVTIRRLNREEYNNTIRDLVGIAFRPADDFPSDDVGYGFDNIGDVLSLSPLLLEKYLSAAEQIVNKAIVTDDPRRSKLVRVPGDKLAMTETVRGLDDGTRLITGLGAVHCEYFARTEGDYILRVKAYGEQAGTEPVKMSISVDGRFVHFANVTATRDEPKIFEKRIKLAEGGRKIAATFLNDYSRPTDPDPTKRDRNLAVSHIEIEGPIGLEPTPLPESHTRIIFRQPTLETEGECAREIVERFATRAFRRPVPPEEVARYLKLYDLARTEGDGFEQGIQLALQGILVSPHFLFRIEVDKDPKDPKAIHPITDFELATRLSYFLWSTMPDEELFALAREGKLREGDNLASQIKRMLADPKSKEFVENFAGQWLQLRSLMLLAPDTKRFPEFDDSLRAAMREETLLFFETVMKEDRSILDFIDADFTYLNGRLAKHYGIPGVDGSEFRRVALPPGPRGGILTQASILTVTSNPTRTSPVKRGKWILEELLGEPPPPPPPNVPELEAQGQSLTGTLRQKMEQHRSNPSCASCHARLDPLGFGLENFNAIGGWRDKEGDFPIDASGELPDGSRFQGPAELKQILKSKQAEFRRCLTEKMLTYALGRGLEYYDQCAVDEIVEALAADGNRFSRLILEVASSEPFQQRRGKGKDE
ncbi:MAG: DUF1592 domain-containing protein [Planctomycetota bacterium]